MSCSHYWCYFAGNRKCFNLEATFSAIHDVYQPFHFSYFELGCDTLCSGTTVLPLKMKTLCLSTVVLHTYQTAECHKPEDNKMNSYNHTVSNIVHFLCFPVSSAETEIKPCDINYNRFISICVEDVAQKFKGICQSFQLIA